MLHQLVVLLNYDPGGKIILTLGLSSGKASFQLIPIIRILNKTQVSNPWQSGLLVLFDKTLKSGKQKTNVAHPGGQHYIKSVHI